MTASAAEFEKNEFSELSSAEAAAGIAP